MFSKLTDQDPFSNGTEFMWFLERNCNWCIKRPHPHIRDRRRDTKCRCSIYNEIVRKMYDRYGKIKSLTVDICGKGKCPYLKEEYPRHTNRRARLNRAADKLQLSLFPAEEETTNNQ